MKFTTIASAFKSCLPNLTLLAGILLTSVAGAQTTSFIPADANWDNPANWTNGLPTAALETIIDGNRTATLTAPTTAATADLTVGLNSGAASSLILAGGSLTTHGNAILGSAGGSFGSATLNNGTWSIGSPGSELWLGVDGTAELNLNGGILEARQVKTTGAADFIFAGGTLRLLQDQSALFSGFGTNTVNFFGAGGTIDTNSFNATIGVAMGGDERLTKTGQGSLTLTAANNYDGGTAVNGGTLRLGNGGSVKGDVNVDTNSAFAFARTDDYTFSGVIGGLGGMVLESGILRLVNLQDYIGPTHIQGGILVLPTGTGFGISSASVVTLDAGASLDISNQIQSFTLQGEGTVYSFGGFAGLLDLRVTAGNTREFSGTLGGPLPNFSVSKGDPGTMILSGSNTYTGDTYVYGGTLLINNTVGSGTGSGLVTVEGGAVLGGSGRIGGDLTFEAGALFAFAPSNTLTLDGTLTIDITFGVASLRDLTGAALDWTSIADGAYSIIEGDLPTFSPANISNFGFANAFDIGSGRFAYFDNGSVPNTSLDLIVVPEPATLLLLGLGLLAAAALRRRRCSTH